MDLQVNGKASWVYMDGDQLKWTSLSHKKAKNGNKNNSSNNNNDNKRIKCLPIAQVIGLKSPQKSQSQPQEKKKSQDNKIRIYYAKRNNRRLLKLKKVTFKLSNANHLNNHHHHRHHEKEQQQQLDEQQQEEAKKFQEERKINFYKFIEHVEEILNEKRKERPSKLLIYVNPYGGKGKALHLYESQIRRLFDIANVDVRLIITKYANHARDTIEDPKFNLDCFDGIICVGGDGMFSELMNGLLFRYNRDRILSAQNQIINNLNYGNDNDNNTNNNDAQSNKITTNINSNNNDDLHQRENNMTVTTTTTSDDYNSNGTNNNTNSEKDSSNEIISNNKKMELVEKEEQQQQQQQLRLTKLRLALGGIGKQFISPPIPLGVIGAGSTDANSFGLIGTNDVITATLNIILGNQVNIDVCSIHSIKEDKLLKFVSTFVGYGYFGDVIRQSEKLRWLGPSRYDVTGFNTLLKNRTYNGLVRILISQKDGTPLESERCHTNCKLCLATKQQKTNNTNGEGETKTKNSNYDENNSLAHGFDFRLIEKEGSFVGVNAAVTACRCPQTKKGFSPNNHLSNGCADLILVLPCTRLQYVQYLLRTGWTKKSAFDLDYVEAYRCRQFEFIASKQKQKQLRHDEQQALLAKEQPSSSSSLDSAIITSGSTSSSNYHSTNLPSSSSSSSSECKQKGSCSSNSLNSTGESNATTLTTTTTSRKSKKVGSSWNADGEILEEQSIRVKVNNQLLRVFGTGEPEKRAILSS